MSWQLIIGAVLLVNGLLILLSKGYRIGFINFLKRAHSDAPQWEKILDKKWGSPEIEASRAWQAGIFFTMFGGMLILIGGGFEYYREYDILVKVFMVGAAAWLIVKAFFQKKA